MAKQKPRNLAYEKKFRTYLFSRDFETHKKKLIKSIEIISKPLVAANSYQVRIEVDDAVGQSVTTDVNWTSLGTVTTTGTTYQYFDISKTARRFRIRIDGTSSGANTVPAEITKIILRAETLRGFT